MPPPEEESLQEDLDGISDVRSSAKTLADEVTKIAQKQLSVSNKYKEPLVSKWKAYEELKAGIVKKKLRVQFNVALPVFSGMLDTLAADFDEPVELKFEKKHPSDYFKVQRIQSAWDLEKVKYDRDARWDFKARIDTSLNILHGRSILKEYAYSNPKYHNVLGNTDPLYFHNQPTGGGLLENHLFAGEEAIMRTESELRLGDQYDKEQVKELVAAASSDDYMQESTEWNREKLQRFTVLGLDPESNNYVGEKTFNLVEWVLTHKGTRYYVLFDPWTGIWIRFDKLKDIFSKDLYPWVSWASFEDSKVFWTQGYADIIYPVADSIVTLFNQELTNREKRNLGARGYDKDMFPDVAKLDEAQYRADALVPVDTKGGSRKISDGLYHFETPELQGTIALLDWTNGMVQRETGVNDISQGVAQNAAKKVNVAYMEQAATAKRLGYKSQSRTEAWGEVGMRFVGGLKDHMSQPMYIEILGDQGIEPDVLSREDLDLKGEIGVKVISSTAAKAETQKKKESRIEAVKLLMQDPNLNSEWKTAAVLSDIGDYDESEIKLALDTKNYASRESVAKAHICIEEMLAGDTPDKNYAADGIFLKIIYDYAMEHRNKIGMEKYKKFVMYVAEHAELAKKNAERSGTERGLQQRRAAMMQNPPDPGSGTPAPAGGAPTPQPEMAQAS